MDPRLEGLVERSPAWLLPGGPDEDVVVAARVRLARNLADRPFPQRMDTEASRSLCQQARERLADAFPGGLVLEPNGLGPAEQDFLVERSLATRDLLDAPRPTLVIVEANESLGLLVNEEDHFRLQSFACGANLEVAWKALRPLARRLAERFSLARSPRYGFLTACPTNTGTGLRASLLLHLPALARARTPLQRSLQAARRSYLEVRGVHGEGSRALGDLYQISNQRTLGSDVHRQIEGVAEFGREVSAYEREVRRALVREAGSRRALLDDARAAYERLCGAEALSSAAALKLLSLVRLAVQGGLDKELGIHLDPHLMLVNSFQIQPGHLQARVGESLPPEQRDAARARLLRSALDLPAAKPDQGS